MVYTNEQEKDSLPSSHFRLVPFHLSGGMRIFQIYLNCVLVEKILHTILHVYLKYEKSIFEIITLETRNLEFQEKDRSLELLWSRLCLRLWTRKNIGRRGDWLSCQVAKLVHSTNETNNQRARFDKKEERKEKERENNWKIIVSRF